MILDYLNRSKFLFLHFLFWIGVWFFYFYFFSYNSENTTYVMWFASFLLPVTMTSTYVVVYYLIPKYLLVRKYLRFILYNLYTVIFSTYFILLGIFTSFIFLSDLEVKDMPLMSRNYIFIVILVYLIVGIISFISLLRHNFQTISKNRELENKILETQLQLKDQELQYLKKQIHPHFLFNSLNTIYGYALKKADDAPEMILKLSNLLDYILYQIDKPQVLLKDELNHLYDYVSLEKMRFHDTLEVTIENGISNGGIKIAPMLLIPFVENSFKHGTIIDEKLTVAITSKFEDDILNFSIRNSSIKDDQEAKGIGLENIKKRLEMLYPNQHSIEIVQQKNEFKVALKIYGLSKL